MNVVRGKLYHQAWYPRTLESTNVVLSAGVTVLTERQTSIEVLKEEKRGSGGVEGKGGWARDGD